ncbi:nicotinate-nucleotide-dimethylbenzimidazole phosphoribosyltransferase [Hydrogenispora ethanolica]|jgi:nicotinate-nucleotide--dimethylbenzimidazole phosphoribosyltransferase|uniref:Nicotinate-nucleotide--dimethylbenzimidazole phosphoribosyltransferase n=1 Tax=Hydrogenispora ethanolica TaxID=1082276 RepID=A0A4R1S4C7_HYDET|nr:nicotinate-nucleotide--dimethylbenzimidazole phosphoribosyltransferase [Hydrogenispora ethanolica]TCL74086.1 nicotinate-nucleotide-dimethylbenzimidazole phosphoribosyltransferase [Hydrogenispora ethanolica]
MNGLQNTLKRIQGLDQQAIQAIRVYEDTLTKPPGSLGVLESIAAQLGGITGQAFPEVAAPKAVVVMAADHGVVAEGVSAFPQEVTVQMVANFCNGGAAINVLARHAGADVVVVDVGVAAPIDHPQVISKKVRLGSANMAQGPALTREEAVQALEVGIAVAGELIDRGYRLLATGEMGIGNTTASSAIVAAFTGQAAAAVTGRGTGLDAAAVGRKAAVIDRALAVNRPDPADPLDVLAKVGGLDIAGLAGLILGAAARRVPVVIDGFISSAAALVAARLAPLASGYMIASHCSAEAAHRRLLELLGLKPLLELEMRLGEGTGAVLAFGIIDAALKTLREMATFESAGVAKGEA